MNIQQQQAALAALPTDQTAIPILQKIAQGQHPMFPPGTEWMGLAKMNEVKRSMEAAQAMQQAAMGGQQQGTVRDQVQQGIAALAQQQQMQPQAAPQGQPAQAMAAGGQVRRYAEGGEVDPDIDRMRDLQAARERYVRANADTSAIDQALASLFQRMRASQTEAGYRAKGPDTRPAPEVPKEKSDAWDPSKPSVWTGGEVPAGQLRSWETSSDPEALALAAAYRQKFPAQQRASAPAPTGGSSGSGITSVATQAPAPAAARSGIAALTRPAMPEMELGPDPVALRKELAANEPDLQGDKYADRTAYANTLRQRLEAARGRDAGADDQMQREAWTRKLLAAANAAGDRRGIAGIASALGGFAGQAAEESEYSRRVQESRLARDEKLEDLRMQYEMETNAARRADAEGRVKEAMEHKAKAVALRNEAKKLAYQTDMKVYELDRESQEKSLDRQGRMEQQALANQGSLSVASVREGDAGSSKAVRAMTAVQQVLNNHPQYKELAKTASMAPNSPLGQKATAEMRRIEEEIYRRFAPELLESSGAAKPAAAGTAGGWGVAEKISK